MTVHYDGHGVTLHHGDCLDVLRSLPDVKPPGVCPGCDRIHSHYNSKEGTVEKRGQA